MLKSESIRCCPSYLRVLSVSFESQSKSSTRLSKAESSTRSKSPSLQSEYLPSNPSPQDAMLSPVEQTQLANSALINRPLLKQLKVPEARQVSQPRSRRS